MRKQLRIQWIWAAAAIVLLGMSACSKDNEKDNQPEPPGEESIYNKLITVSNFTGDTSSLTAPDANREVIFYSLELNKPCPEEYLLTNRWDVSFSGVYNTSIGGNYGADPSPYASLGKGGPGKGGVMIIDTPFSKLTSVPANVTFSTRAAGFGLDADGAFGEGVGWAIYDWNGDLRSTVGIGGNGPDQAHTCWARPDRTIIVRTALGNYAKLRIISLYKDAPDEPKTKDPAHYFTFEYVIAAPGTMDFTIK